jgi:hypothetical protein
VTSLLPGGGASRSAQSITELSRVQLPWPQLSDNTGTPTEHFMDVTAVAAHTPIRRLHGGLLVSFDMTSADFPASHEVQYAASHPPAAVCNGGAQSDRQQGDVPSARPAMQALAHGVSPSAVLFNGAPCFPLSPISLVNQRGELRVDYMPIAYEGWGVPLGETAASSTTGEAAALAAARKTTGSSHIYNFSSSDYLPPPTAFSQMVLRYACMLLHLFQGIVRS